MTWLEARKSAEEDGFVVATLAEIQAGVRAEAPVARGAALGLVRGVERTRTAVELEEP